MGEGGRGWERVGEGVSASRGCALGLGLGLGPGDSDDVRVRMWVRIRAGSGLVARVLALPTRSLTLLRSSAIVVVLSVR